MLPNFLCIGAQKSGTTTLYTVLSRHPDVLLSVPKETDFFQDPRKFSKGIATYEDYFSHWSGESAVGEIEPDYLPYPEVPQRIRASLGGGIKIFAVLRNPVDRAYSHYQMNRRKGYERLGFEAALEAESTRVKQGPESRFRFNYGGRGLYFASLQHYLAAFSPDAFRFFLFEEDLLERPGGTLQAIQEHIGVEPRQLDSKVQENVAKKPIVPILGRLLHQENPIKNAARKLLPSGKLRMFVRNMLETRSTAPPLQHSIRQELLQKYFLEDIEKLEDLLGRSLARWRI